MKPLHELRKLHRPDLEIALGLAGPRDDGGVFAVHIGEVELYVIVGCGVGWDHISVSTATRTPTWAEMENIRRLFFHDYETVMQLHPPIADYVTGEYPGGKSKFVLHLWRPHKARIPRPPQWMVGGNSPQEVKRNGNQANVALSAEASRRIK